MKFQYAFNGRDLREGDVIDGVWRTQFIYDAVVVRPNCFEYGYDLMRNGDYQVQVKVGSHTFIVNRSDISNVRRPYQIGDWAA